MTKNQFMSVTTALAMLVAAANSAAQTFPTKLIRLIVPFAPGGGNDVLGRMFALRMSESLAQTVVVDNRAGGGGNIGTEMVAHAPPDGYTLLYTTNSVAVAPSLYSKLNYSLKDLAPISLVADFPIAIVIHPSVPARNVKELIALALKRGGLNYGSTGTGSTNHLTGVLLNSVAGINNTHVPYKGAGPMMTAIISGEVEIATPTVFTALPYVQAGRLRALAVTTPHASPMLPGVPTMASFYPGFDTNVWHGYFTTAGTPAAVIGVLHREIIKALRSPEIRESLVNGGAESVGTTPEEFGTILTRDVAKYSKLVQISGAKAD
jgi:tripartite-type tricarboxylate transporter receptor subunit TctC